MPTTDLALSPHGNLYIEASLQDLDGVDPQADSLVEQAFLNGVAHGLLHLGAAEIDRVLPPAYSYFRDFARRFVTALSVVPDLESERERVKVPAPATFDIDALVASAPPMRGFEYLASAVLEELWRQLEAAFHVEIKAFPGTVQTYLHQKSPLWNLVGRVHFHLAENKQNEAEPFAFLATYTTRISAKANVQHTPLGRALQEYSGTGNKSALLALLQPVQRAAAASPLLRDLVDSGALFHPLSWTPKQAHQFLQSIPAFEAGGIVVRVPNWWNGKRPSRPKVSVHVGSRPASQLGMNAMLDFSVNLTLDGETLSEKERQQILESKDGLSLIRGKWIELDRQKLEEVLAHWKSVQRKVASEGVSFNQGMRLLAGVPIGLDHDDGAEGASSETATPEWSEVIAGDWLTSLLHNLRVPGSANNAHPGKDLRATLRPYQTVGVEWLWLTNSLGLGACLADDMGLGKTIQVIALLLLLKQRKPDCRTSLLVVPASLVDNWRSEIERFAPGLRTLIAHPSALPASDLASVSAQALKNVDVVITSYGAVGRYKWFGQTEWELVVLDEAQAIKNPNAKQTRTVKTLKSRTRLALTGTPVENKLGDLWSIFDFTSPGLLGSSQVFSRFAKRLAAREHNAFGPLRQLVKPYILRRLKSDKSIISDLPDKTEVTSYCSLTKVQAALYQQMVDDLSDKLAGSEGIQRRGVILAFLMRFKQVCNHPSQWLGDSAYAPSDSGKFARLRELCEEIASRQEKVLIFTQFKEMTTPLSLFLEGIFGRAGLVLHGATPVKKRPELVAAFQSDRGPPFFVLSLKAGGTGLNLTAASHVIHFDRWWNPAVENQATDRAYRIGQKRNVLVHKFVCRGTIEEKIDALIRSKQSLSSELLEGGGEVLLTEMRNDEIMKLVSLDIRSALQET